MELEAILQTQELLEPGLLGACTMLAWKIVYTRRGLPGCAEMPPVTPLQVPKPQVPESSTEAPLRPARQSYL